jgi:hypothetical protein
MTFILLLSRALVTASLTDIEALHKFLRSPSVCCVDIVVMTFRDFATPWNAGHVPQETCTSSYKGFRDHQDDVAIWTLHGILQAAAAAMEHGQIATATQVLTQPTATTRSR